MLANTIVMDASSEWMAARAVQEGFMRFDAAVDGLDYSARCRQAKQLGGDCYVLEPLSDHRLALMVGDASGKGLAAALMISNVQSSLRTAFLLTGSNAATALRVVNRQVFGSSLEDRYATLFFAVFDEPTRTLRYVNAGHPPPMILRRDGSTVWLETGGAAVGLFSDWIYEEDVVRLSPGDIMIAYTDGLTEARSLDGHEWGAEGLRRAAVKSGAACAEDLVSALFTSLDEFSCTAQTDDATLMAVRVR